MATGEWLLLGAVVGNLLCAYLNHQAKQEWYALIHQYQYYVALLERRVQEHDHE